MSVLVKGSDRFRLISLGSGLTPYSNTMSLDRFIQAQEKTYAGALAELKAGKKKGCWIWWIFPQLRGLGTSYESTYYGITDAEEALAYFEHPVLGLRYRECVAVVHGQLCQNGVAPLKLLGGEVDVRKLRSSLKLFLGVIETPEESFREQADQIIHVLGRGC
jgi:uncharacterized protein (DUF1810 family)